MAVDLANDLWQEIKRYVSVVDRHDAADAVVSLLIDNDFDAGQIKDAFKGDNDIKRALQSYLDDTVDDEDLEEEDEDDYNDDY
jgi:hypothetical protein